MTQLKYQNYKHYKLPITMNPLEYGKLIFNINNIFIIQVNKTNIALINKNELLNIIKLFKEGDLILEYKDFKTNENTFVRSLNNKKFTFENNILKFLEKPINRVLFKLSLIFLLFIILFVIFPEDNSNIAIAGLSTTFDSTTFSKDNITFSSDHVNNKKLFKIGNYHYFKIHKLEINVLKDFLEQLESKKGYIVLPILAVEGLDSNTPILSLTNQILVSKDSDPNIILNFLLNQIELTCANYGIDNWENSIIVFKFRPIALKDVIIQKISKIRYDIKDKIYKKNITLLNSKYYNGSILPLSMNLNVYGNQLSKILSTLYILRFNLNPNGLFFKKDEFIIYINKKDNGNHEGILFKEKGIFYKFEDLLVEGNSFIRITDKFIIHIDNFNISYFEKLINNNFITNSNPKNKLNTNIVTFDIETYIKDGKFIPFACGWYDGNSLNSYYLSDYKSPYEMLLQSLIDLLDFNPNAKVYIHNFSNFDYMFLIKVLFENFIVKPNFKDNKVINLIYQQKSNNKTKIELLDSYLILPSSLRTLALKYKVSDKKGFFPYNFVNENNLNYIGITPDISLFCGITNEEYEGLISNNWNLRNELIKYLELDLKSLYQVIINFSRDIFNVEKIDITKLPTNSAISFKIFRTNYLKDTKLPIIKGNAHKEIRNAYYGGVVEVFKNEGNNLKYYESVFN